MYLEEPHRTTRGYTELRDRVGSDIFGENHRLEPYYAAAYAYILLDTRFRAKNIPSEYKSARYHILLALRMLVDREKPVQMNAHEMGRRADRLLAELWNTASADDLFMRALKAIDDATGGNLERDHVRTLSVRNNILSQFGRNVF